MPAGRPLKWNNEKEYQKYLVENANIWVKEFFKDDIKNIKEQWYLTKFKKFGSNKPRIDICIETLGGKRIGIEVKNPKNIYGELSRTISQILSYAIIAEENEVPFDEIAIISSEYDEILIKTIKKFNLPLRIFIITKEYHGEIV